MQPRALCCVQAWISPLQLGELHGPPTYAAGAEKGMLTRISSGSALRHLATGPLSRSGSCSILLCSAVLFKLTRVRQLQQRCAQPCLVAYAWVRHFSAICAAALCAAPSLLNVLQAVPQKASGRMPAQFAMQRPMQYTVWQLGSAKQLSFVCLIWLHCAAYQLVTTKSDMLVLGRPEQTTRLMRSAA